MLLVAANKNKNSGLINLVNINLCNLCPSDGPEGQTFGMICSSFTLYFLFIDSLGSVLSLCQRQSSAPSYMEEYSTLRYILPCLYSG